MRPMADVAPALVFENTQGAVPLGTGSEVKRAHETLVSTNRKQHQKTPHASNLFLAMEIAISQETPDSHVPGGSSPMV